MDKVEVTQSAKDAAKDVARAMGQSVIEQAASQGVNVTMTVFDAPDDHPLVQAIAAAEQRGFKLCQDAAVKVAEDNKGASGGRCSAEREGWDGACDYLLDAIRTLSIKETGNGE